MVQPPYESGANEQSNPETDRLAHRAHDLILGALRTDVPVNLLQVGTLVNFENSWSHSVDYTDRREEDATRDPLSDTTRSVGMSYETAVLAVEEEERTFAGSPLLESGWGRVITRVEVNQATGKTSGTRQFYSVSDNRFVLDHEDHLSTDEQTSEADRIMDYLDSRLSEHVRANSPMGRAVERLMKAQTRLAELMHHITRPDQA